MISAKILISLSIFAAMGARASAQISPPPKLDRVDLYETRGCGAIVSVGAGGLGLR